MIAQTLALRHPELIRSLILIDTVSTFGDQVRASLRERAMLTRTKGMQGVLENTLSRWFTPEFAGRRPDIIDRVTKTLLAGNSDLHAGMWEMIAKLDSMPELHKIAKPTLVLVGEQDQTTPVAASQVIAEQIQDAKIYIMANTSHISPVESPILVNKRLMDYMASS